MGWAVPWFSSASSSFNVDFGLTTKAGETFGLSVFLRDGDSVFQTYFTTGRGVEAIGTVWSLLDRTPFGRQEDWRTLPRDGPRLRGTPGGAVTTSTSTPTPQRHDRRQ